MGRKASGTGSLAVVAEQYRDSTNLDSRQSLHDGFGSGAVDWHRWLFDVIALGQGERLVEAGSGPGTLWRENQDRLPAMDATLTDLSSGMAFAGRAHLGSPGFRFAVAAVQALPFPDAGFDVATANHMLYHVSDLDRALAELRRVLRPGGRLVAATNGAEHMAEVTALMEKHLDADGRGSLIGDFSLESGGEALARHFRQVEVLRAPLGPLLVTEVEPLLRYARSLGSHRESDEEAWSNLAAEVRETMAREGAFRITRAAGAFVCRP